MAAPFEKFAVKRNRERPCGFFEVDCSPHLSWQLLKKQERQIRDEVVRQFIEEAISEKLAREKEASDAKQD